MNLSASIREAFLSQDRKRGNPLADAGKVEVLALGTLGALAIVEGSGDNRYRVAFDFEELDYGIVSGYCECIRYAEGDNCKHLWAFGKELDGRLYGLMDFPPNVQVEAIDHLAELQIGELIEDGSPANRVSTKAPEWKRSLATIAKARGPVFRNSAPIQESGRNATLQRWYALRLKEVAANPTFIVHLFASPKKRDGSFGVPRKTAYNPYETEETLPLSDRKVLALLEKESNGYSSRYSASGYTLSLSKNLLVETLTTLCSTGRFVWTSDGENSLSTMTPIRFAGTAPWKLSIQVSEIGNQQVEASAMLQREVATEPDATQAVPQEQRSVEQVLGVCESGAVLFEDEIGILDRSSILWARAWRQAIRVTLDRSDLSEFMLELLGMEDPPEVDLQKSLGIDTAAPKPRGMLRIESINLSDMHLRVNLSWLYGNSEVPGASSGTTVWDATEERILRRDPSEEIRLLAQLGQERIHEHYDRYYNTSYLRLRKKDLMQAVHSLSEKGWDIVAEGAKIVRPGNFDIRVESGEDWFDLQADVQFGEQSAALPTLLKAVRKGDRYVQLDDGSQGILPEEWLEKYQRLVSAGTEEGDRIRFTNNQALLLDMMLEEEEVKFDRRFTSWCKKLNSFSGVKPRKAPRSFKGELRDYQKDALGWLSFLKDFKLGGCLADDMGLGKTVQVLAHLESRRVRRLPDGEVRKPSLAVVPKSLIFNWIDEAARFVPKMKVLDYTGTDRAARLAEIADVDLVITTYATMRRDIQKLRTMEFDYVVLDEAQAIKNPSAQVTKAARLLKGEHRLAMTGTPVENHLGDLWSLFDFLNPGMLGATTAAQFTGDEDQGRRLSALSRALKPFILRRTKAQVLTELPDKTEQTLVCEMSPKQRKLYDELRDHYRARLTKKIEKDGIKRSKIQVLEALLRLRQSACDPRLVDPDQKTRGAKIDLLLDQITELHQEGHKVLVFSQFTTLLGLVRSELDKSRLPYEYLDGKTKDRAACVKRFQEDDDCRVFLISLKAGGHGLNLTSANYVFILDPWWNPAVEAQAIDRAHRMGQANPVTAYRLIAKDTVEDKIIKLQDSKRELADAIVSADSSLISKLSMSDLRLLFE